MEERWRVIAEEAEGAITEKRSRFIASLAPAATREEAEAFIERKKKQYWDARHNCYAYVLARGEETRYSDDGEPAQTAGRPMLEILQRERVTDAVVVVTRYFGGILLGTGGLMRAYQGAVKAGLEQCRLLELRRGCVLRIKTDYKNYGRIEYLLREHGLTPEGVSFDSGVELRVTAEEEQKKLLAREIADATGGSAVVEAEGPVDFFSKTP